jgi:hypothetical protein
MFRIIRCVFAYLSLELWIGRQDLSPNHIHFDTKAFAPVTAVRYGTSGETHSGGPGSFQMDASLFRSVPIWREIEFKFGAEAFDITNTPTFNSL